MLNPSNSHSGGGEYVHGENLLGQMGQSVRYRTYPGSLPGHAVGAVLAELERGGNTRIDEVIPASAGRSPDVVIARAGPKLLGVLGRNAVLICIAFSRA
jgi:hypothetical protein